MYNPNTARFSSRNDIALDLEQVRRRAPSAFATQPWEQTSDKYRFFPTSEVLTALMNNGFEPVEAQQSRTRIEGKGEFTKHMIRLRHKELTRTDLANVGDEVPEVVLLNSHDGSSSYRLMLGMFRLVCSNGLIVASSMVNECRVRHSGREDLIGDVLEGSFKIIEEAPKAIAQINQWKGIELSRAEQEVFAKAAIEARDTTLEVQPGEALVTRRSADRTNDLWTTLNVVQENLIKGGMDGRNATGKRSTVRGVKSVDGNTKLNRALWTLGEEMAKIKVAA